VYHKCAYCHGYNTTVLRTCAWRAPASCGGGACAWLTRIGFAACGCGTDDPATASPDLRPDGEAHAGAAAAQGEDAGVRRALDSTLLSSVIALFAIFLGIAAVIVARQHLGWADAADAASDAAAASAAAATGGT